MGGIIVSKKARKRIEKIYEHPDEVFSIYRKDCEEVEWVQGKAELYEKIKEIERST